MGGCDFDTGHVNWAVALAAGKVIVEVDALPGPAWMYSNMSKRSVRNRKLARLARGVCLHYKLASRRVTRSRLAGATWLASEAG